MIHHLLGSGVDSAGVVVGVSTVGLEEVALRMMFARVSGLASSCQIGFATGGTMQAYDSLKASLLVAQSAVLGWRWFGFYSASDRRTLLGSRGYSRFVPVGS